ncbi:hypothetical protein [Kutzneria buriramensis]|uniref:hypothetical protein n=1 Tax=Kutzneria buriramensis TaxID=1045776 RepID=UPI0011C15F7C|nr:hypothetical protein [Kutzneria buriramensis]
MRRTTSLAWLNIVLRRHWLRGSMQACGITTPGRRRPIVEENERLLAVLLSEGLSNDQLARVLRISRKTA